MEFIVGIVSSIVTEVAKCMSLPVTRHAGYMLNRKNILEDFRKKVELLKDERGRVKNAVDAAERNGEKIEEDVQRWLISVDKTLIEEADQVRTLEDKAKKRCFIGWCPNLKSYYQLGKKAEDDSKVVDELLEQGRFDRVSYRPAMEEIVVALPNKAYQAFQSRASTVEGIMEALRDPNVKSVGVFGMAGVGKTMLVKEVARKAREDQYLFDEVVMAIVSHNPNIRNIQGEIADMLGLKFDEESESGRAMRLRQRFQLRNDKKILVILDDIWGRLDLDAIGICLEEENKIAGNGEQGYIMQNNVKVRSKVLLTSRSQAVLQLMNTQRHFQVGVLSEEEAMDLFKKIVGETVKKPDYRQIAVEVVGKCAGLPVAISVIGHALKDVSLDTWDNALQQLRRSNPINIGEMQEGVYSAIELSYQLLKNQEAQLLFQLCALYPQGSDINVSYLQRFSLGLELLEDIDTLDDARKSVNIAVDKLKASSLLLSSDSDGLVKMHDIIRDVSISIASKEKQMFVIMKEVRMKELLKRGKLNNCTAMSMPYGDFHELPNVLDCPNLNLLMLFNKDRPLSVPEAFFSKMSELKVLHLAGMHFPSLPTSFHSLTNLRTLCLLACKLGDIAMIGKLINLDILSFDGSEIEQLPREIGELTQLRLLDLSNCSKLKVIPADIISSLSCLEELYMGNSFDQWDVEGNASLGELKFLHQLTTLHVHIRDPSIMPSGLFCEKLVRYKIFIGDIWDWSGKYEHLRTLKFKLNTSIDLDHGIRMVLKKTEDLYLDQLKGVNNVLSQAFECGKGFPHLKKLHVQNEPDMEYIIIDDGVANIIEFSQLRSITLQDLPKLISFCLEEEGQFVSGQGQADTTIKSLPLFNEKMVFCCLENLRLSSINVERIWANQLSNILDYTQNLTSLIIEGCENLKHLFSSSIARSLVNLRCFEIAECTCLREIIFTEDIEEENMVPISFPQLNSLKIKNLQHLVGFCSKNYKIEFPSLKLLEIKHCPKMKGFIDKSSTVQENQCFSQEALFDEKVAFPSLEKLIVSHLRNMKMIWHNQLSVNSFCKLEEIEVEHCDELLTIFPLDMLGTFQQLQTLSVTDCGSLEDIFDLQRLDMKEAQTVDTQLRKLYAVNLPKLKNVWSMDPHKILTFQNLSVVFVFNCWSLKNVFPASVAEVLPQLKNLAIGSCGVEEIILKREGSKENITFEFEQVSSLMLWNLPKLKCFYPGMHTANWPRLKKLKAYHCNQVKILDTECLNLPDLKEDDPPTQPPFFLVEKVVPTLKEVSLTSDDIAMICDSKFSRGLFHDIKTLHVHCYHDRSAIFPITFLDRFKYLETLELTCCNFAELFSNDVDIAVETNAGIVLAIRNLRLNGLHHLKHVWKQESRIDSVFPNLEALKVVNCGNLISLGSSSAPFQNLMILDVWGCEKMVNLVTSAAVQSLVQLKNLKIRNCVSMKEIVGNDGYDEARHIIFNRLKCLELWHLPRLRSFCSGNHTFGFPSLDQAIVNQCPELEIFCKGVLDAPMLQRVQVTDKDGDKGQWDGNLNSTIHQLYTKKVDYEGMEYLVLSEFSKSIEIWKENLQESLDLKNLQCLEVYECNSLTSVFNASMALDLVQLQKLMVKNCLMLKQIITDDGAEEATTKTIMFPSLLSISLVSCSNLTSFYLGGNTVEYPSLGEILLADCPRMFTFGSTFMPEQDIETTIGTSPLFNDKVAFPNLRHLAIQGTGNWRKIWDDKLTVDSFCELSFLVVENCARVFNIFPFNMMERLEKLEELHILNCESLEEVIEPDHGFNSGVSTAAFVFPKMRFLALHKLPKLKSFYSKMHATDWPSLKELQVIGCDKVEILARMYLSFRETLGESQLEISVEQPLFWVNEVAFPELETMTVSCLRNMTTIWHNQLPVNSFCKLKKLAVEQCDELLTIFPPDMLHTFQRLQTLRVSSCGSVEDIFELPRLNMEEMHIVATQLRELHILNLPKLKHVWNNDPQGTLTFQNLRIVIVWKCWNLKYVFPASVARVLPKLEDLQINCCGVEEIVSKEEELEMATTFEFEQVSSLMLWNLPKLKCFYPGMHTTKWPKLKKLKAYHCNQVKILDSECLNLPDMNEDGQLESQIQPPLFLVEKVVPKLEEVSLNSDDIAMICERDSKFSKGLFHETEVLHLLCYHDGSANFPTTFLERFNSLEKLEVTCCKFEALFSDEGGVGMEKDAQTILPIRNLRLNSLHYLKHIWMQESRLGCILPNLETLEVLNCGNLISFGSSSAPFQNLTTLDVWECEGMINLVTSIGAAQSLVQLRNLRMRNCVAVKEIVGNEGNDAMSYIVFERLKCLELQHLPGLKSFCSGNHTFEFPSLHQVIVTHCPEMEIFCKGLLNAPMLQRVQLVDKDDKGHWYGDLNTTVQQLYTKKVEYEGMEYLILSEFSKSMEIWKDNLQESLDFKSLQCLEVYDCNSLTYIFTNSMALDLVQLKKMKVKNCPMMEQIIRNDGANEAATCTIMFPSLQSISLESCSNLTNFYLGSNTMECPFLMEIMVADCPKMFAFSSASPENIGTAPLFSDKVAFPNLREMGIQGTGNWTKIWDEKLTLDSFRELNLLLVKNCGRLLHIFPFYMVERLDKLEALHILNCDSLEEIIGPDHELHSSESTAKPIFPKMRALDLDKLPKLKSFYSKVHTVHWPYLKDLQVIECNNVDILVKERLNFPEMLGDSELEISFQQSLFWVSEDAFPNLEWLVLEGNSTMKEIWHGQLPTQIFCKLKHLLLVRIPDTSVTILKCFVQACPNLESLDLIESPFKEIFPCEGLGIEEVCAGAFSRLSELRLSKLPELTHLWNEEFPVAEVFNNLRILDVLECGKLQNLVPSFVYFENLMTLEVSKCHGLEHLITLPTAKRMVLLRKMIVTDCKMIEEIVAHASDEVKDGIIFSQLKSLELGGLPSLSSFCSENFAFGFPSLETVTVRNCPKMKIFCKGDLSAPNVQKVQFAKDKERWDDNLNTTMEQIFMEMNAHNSIEE